MIWTGDLSFNIGSDRETSIKALAVKNVVGFHGDLVFHSGNLTYVFKLDRWGGNTTHLWIKVLGCCMIGI